MRMTLKQLQDSADRGRIAQATVDEVLASQERGRQRLAGIVQQGIEESRFTLTAPVEFTVPLELWTENRLRAMEPHHRGRHVKAQRALVCNCWQLTFRHKTPALPVEVTFTRHGRHMDGHDSLAAAFKHVTDEVTRLLGLSNDDTPEVTWKYQQTPRGSEPMKITIRIAPCAPASTKGCST